MFDEKFEALAHADQEDFARSINHLLSHSFIVRDVFDPKEKIMKINAYYRFVERNFDLVDEYLNFIGYSISKDNILGVIVLENSYYENRIKIDRETSLVVYVLRLIYENLKEDNNGSTQAVFITTNTLIKTMNDYQISFPNKKLTGRVLAKSLRLLANHNIINKVSGSYDEGDVNFYILPSIVYAIDGAKAQAMADTLDKLKAQSNNVNMSKFEGDF